MQHKFLAPFLLAPALLLGALSAQSPKPPAVSQTNDPIDQMHIPYGVSINLADAKKVVAAAVAEAHKQNWQMAIAVTDVSGLLVYYERLDGTENASADMSVAKAKTAVLYRRSTKSFEDRLAQGGANLRVLGMAGVVPVDGGIPLVVGGKIIGAIGVSGGSSQEDGRCAAAGAAALQ